MIDRKVSVLVSRSPHEIPLNQFLQVRTWIDEPGITGVTILSGYMLHRGINAFQPLRSLVRTRSDKGTAESVFTRADGTLPSTQFLWERHLTQAQIDAVRISVVIVLNGLAHEQFGWIKSNPVLTDAINEAPYGIFIGSGAIIASQTMTAQSYRRKGTPMDRLPSGYDPNIRGLGRVPFAVYPGAAPQHLISFSDRLSPFHDVPGGQLICDGAAIWYDHEKEKMTHYGYVMPTINYGFRSQE